MDRYLDDLLLLSPYWKTILSILLGFVFVGLYALLLLIMGIGSSPDAAESPSNKIGLRLLYIVRNMDDANKSQFAGWLCLVWLSLCAIVIVLLWTLRPTGLIPSDIPGSWVVPVRDGDFYYQKVELSNCSGPGATKAALEYISHTGATAEVIVFKFYGGDVHWTIGKAEFSGGEGLETCFSSPETVQVLPNIKAFACVGLASFKDTLGEDWETKLSNDRARALCERVSALLGGLRDDLPFFGFGIGRDEMSSGDDIGLDDSQRPLVVIGVLSATQDLTQEMPRRKMIENILFGGRYLGFSPKNYHAIQNPHEKICWFQLGKLADADGACPFTHDVKSQ